MNENLIERAMLIDTDILVRYANVLSLRENKELELERFISEVNNLKFYEKSQDFNPNDERYLILKSRLIDEYLQLNPAYQQGGQNEQTDRY